MTTTTFPSLTLGTSVAHYLTAFKKKGIQVSGYTDELLGVMPKTTGVVDDLVIVTVADLGFTTYTTTRELYARATERGYELCPAEVGPALRLAYDDQPKGEWLYIAMEPLLGSGRGPRVFAVERRDDGGQWLGTHWTDPESQWSLDCRLVFRLRKSLGTLDTESLAPSLSGSLTLESLAKRIAALEAWQARVQA